MATAAAAAGVAPSHAEALPAAAAAIAAAVVAACAASPRRPRTDSMWDAWNVSWRARDYGNTADRRVLAWCVALHAACVGRALWERDDSFAVPQEAIVCPAASAKAFSNILTMMVGCENGSPNLGLHKKIFDPLLRAVRRMMSESELRRLQDDHRGYPEHFLGMAKPQYPFRGYTARVTR
eukprot:gene30564-5280_t